LNVKLQTEIFYICKTLASRFKLFTDFYFLLILQFTSVTLGLTSRINHNSGTRDLDIRTFNFN